MRAKVIVRNEKDNIVHQIDTSIDESSVNDLVASLRRSYGDSYKIDLGQIDCARQAAAAG
jgi:hypothetical protein